MILTNGKQVNLMIWEVNPRKRNRSEISFYIKKTGDVSEGDCITGLLEEKTGNTSVYEISSITDRRSGALSGFDYVKAKVNFSFKKLIE